MGGNFKVVMIVHFGTKLYFFFYFSALDLREKRDNYYISVVLRKKHWLTLILTTKIIGLGVNEFYLIRKISFRCSFTFKLLERIDLTSKNFYVLD
jgi:hypothetical protein